MKTASILAALALAASVLATSAHAQIDARFIEGAPKDRFTLTHNGGCTMGPVTVRFDLGGTAAGLIFDTTDTGAGVEVFQPFVLVAGAELVTQSPVAQDGDQSVVLELSGFAPGQTLAFTIDVDDTVSTRQITVSGSEIVGAEVSMTIAGQTLSGAFDASGRASIPIEACAS